MNRRRQFFSTIGLGVLLAGGAPAAAREEFPRPGKPRRTFLPTAPARRPEYKVFTVPAGDSIEDAFNAVAEPRRREILTYLALQERPVGEIVDALEMEQPSVSKHLRVLKDVGLVHARRDGRQMFYRTNAAAIRPLHEWAGTFERYWQRQLMRVKERAEEESGAVKKN